MQAQINKHSGSVKKTDSVQKKGAEAAFQFKDNRQEANIQRKIQEQADNHAGVNQLKAIRLMADSSQQVTPFTGISEHPIQMKTDIKYDAPQKFTFGDTTDYVGKKVEATLDPKDPIKGSDTGGSEQDDLMAELPKSTTWKKGHLLNHDLGGRATVWNLFPITTSANSEHYHEVEKIVKHWIGNGNEASYTITAVADNLNDKTNANGHFKCEAKVLNTKDGDEFHGHHIDKTIYSHVPAQKWARKFSKKKDKDQKSFGSVGFNNDNDQVKRDQYGKIKTLPAWDNQSGNQGLNRINKDKTKAVRYTNEKGKLKIKEVEPVVAVQQDPVAVVQDNPVVGVQQNPVNVVQDNPVVNVQQDPLNVVQDNPVGNVQQDPLPVVQDIQIGDVQMGDLQQDPVDDLVQDNPLVGLEDDEQDIAPEDIKLESRAGDPEIFSGEYESEAVEESVKEGADEEALQLLESPVMSYTHAMYSRVDIFYEAGLREYHDALNSSIEYRPFYQEQLKRNYMLLLDAGHTAQGEIDKAGNFLQGYRNSSGYEGAMEILQSYRRTMESKRAHLESLVNQF